MEDDNLDNKNIFLIKFKLSSLSLKKDDTHFTYYVGNYILKIITPPLKEFWLHSQLKDDRVTNHKTVDVHLYELSRREDSTYEAYINLEQDDRFATYLPIKYTQWTGYSNGNNMPILNLCELIKYLRRLSNLTAFL